LLISHLLIEKRINGVLYRWLRQDAPSPPGEPQKVSQAENKLWDTIARMTFNQKFSLLKPFFGIDFEKAVRSAPRINELRNTVFHGREIDNAKFAGKSIAEETTIERIFLEAQERCSPRVCRTGREASVGVGVEASRKAARKEIER